MSQPTIVIAGIRRAGLNLLADMLREGGIPNAAPFAISPTGLSSAGYCIARDPHEIDYLPIDKKNRLGIFIDRSSSQLIQSIERDNANAGRAALAAHEVRILRRTLVLDLKRARDAAAAQFSPCLVFKFDDIIADPEFQSERLGFILGTWWPQFSQRSAAIAVRRILYPPRVIAGAKPRLVSVADLSRRSPEGVGG